MLTTGEFNEPTRLRRAAEAIVNNTAETDDIVRDSFAGLAMQAMVTRDINCLVPVEAVAQHAYNIADAMMVERERRHN